MANDLWSKEKIYDEKIYPLMDKIIKICKENEIPLVAVFQYSNEEDGGHFCSTRLSSGNECQRMKDIINFTKPEKPYSFMETIVTNEDGSKNISIKKL